MLVEQLEGRLRRRLAEDARDLLVERVRTGLWLNMLACFGWVGLDAATQAGFFPVTHLLGGVQVVVLAGALLLLRSRRGREYAVAVALPAIAVVCFLGGRATVLRGDPIGYNMLLVAMTMGAAAFIPWGTASQIWLVVIAASAAYGTNYFAGEASYALGGPVLVGVGISFFCSIYITRVLQRERADAQNQELRRAIATDALAASREHLRALSARLVSVQEDERTRIAREVHDELGQKLTALKFMASAMHQRAAASGGTTKPAQDMIELLESTLQSVQRIAKSLRPGVLDDLGFGAALTSLVNEFEELTRVDCEIELAEHLAIDRAGSTALYRILQEALTNITRHSGATRVQVSVGIEDGVAELRVEDNGKGMDVRASRPSSALGILGMQERARSCGGDVEIRCGDEKGVVVLAHVRAGERDAVGE